MGTEDDNRTAINDKRKKVRVRINVRESRGGVYRFLKTGFRSCERHLSNSVDRTAVEIGVSQTAF